MTGLDYQTTYTFQARIVDSIETVTTNEISVKAAPVFDWGQDDFNFNVPVTIQGSSVPSIVEQGTSGSWTFRKWSDGIG